MIVSVHSEKTCLKNLIMIIIIITSNRKNHLLHCKKRGVRVHLCHGVVGHLRIWWCNVTLQGVLVRNGVFHNTLKKCSKVLWVRGVILAP